jgi:plastocyanin
VPVGASVVWKNQGNNLHTAPGFDGRWDTGTLGPGQEAEIAFDQPGEYRYYCRQHGLNGMVGRVLVQEPADEEVPSSAT